MTAGDWYLLSFTFGAGASIALLWLWIVASGRYARVAAGRADFAWHVAAELVTAALLLVAGVGLATDAAWADVATGVGLGALVYAITESAGHYLKTGTPWLAFAVLSGWPFTVAAAWILFAR